MSAPNPVGGGPRRRHSSNQLGQQAQREMAVQGPSASALAHAAEEFHTARDHVQRDHASVEASEPVLTDGSKSRSRSASPAAPRSGLTDAGLQAPPPSVKGCHINLGCVKIAIAEWRFLIIRWGQQRVVQEIPPYLYFSFLWLCAFFFGWLAFAHAHPNPFTPGHFMFDLFFLVAVSYVGGQALSRVLFQPPLFGYLIVGMLWRNLPGDPTQGITENFGTIAKEVALCIIVSRAGLGLPVLQFLGDPALHRRNAFPPDDVTFASVVPGMPVALSPEGMTEIYRGVVASKAHNHIIINWNPPNEDGPPDPAACPVKISQRWWDGSANAQPLRPLCEHPSVGDLSRPQWTTLGTGARIGQTLNKARSGLLLACTPMTFEAIFYMVMAILIFQFSPIWGFLLGFVMAAVSPAVVVPGLIDLQKRGFVGGGNSGTPVPAVVIFASGLDDVLAITFFGVFFGIAFGGADPTPKIIKAPLEIIGGCLVGAIFGTLCFYCAQPMAEDIEDSHPTKRELKNRHSAFSVRPTLAATAEQERHDIAHFGLASADNPHPVRRVGGTAGLPRMPLPAHSNDLVSAMVFAVMVSLVIGLSHVEVGEAGHLGSTGVLGAMCSCLVLNYHCAKDAYTAKWYENEGKLLRAIIAFDAAFEGTGRQSLRLQDDPVTRAFFNIQPGHSFAETAHALERKVPEYNLLAERHKRLHLRVELNMKRIWDYAACPLLFALVGRSVVFGDLFDPDVLPKALLCIFVSLIGRCAGAILACTGTGWPWLNRFFVAFAWMPKATVQAAVGGLALAEAEYFCSKHCSHGCTLPELHEEQSGRWNGTDAAAAVVRAALSLAEEATADPEDGCKALYKDQLSWAEKVLQISVVGIIVTAPLGAACIAQLGPRWLEQQVPKVEPDKTPASLQRKDDSPGPQFSDLSVSPQRAMSGLSGQPPSRQQSFAIPVAAGLPAENLTGSLAVRREVRFVADDIFNAAYKRSLNLHNSAIDTASRQQKMRLQQYLKADWRHAPLDINEHVAASGHRPAMRQRYRVKRSSSWPTSLAMANPRDVRKEILLMDPMDPGSPLHIREEALPTQGMIDGRYASEMNLLHYGSEPDDDIVHRPPGMLVTPPAGHDTSTSASPAVPKGMRRVAEVDSAA
eukprot:TRINITY_DN7095_c0_g1_i1.p1 TRINITY_DN7095_c0_g1~~TRINITY_DN7095_c0_g1_i1.p1  ORF type:complete len:1135 (+),score=308.98 TRINITY_DN7095_c0_g1_i1:119-3523(+)